MGAQFGVTLVRHTSGSALTHHPHVHDISPGGGLSPAGKRCVSCELGFFLSVRVLSRQFRSRFPVELGLAYRAGELQFFGEYAELADAKTFAICHPPVGKFEWVVYAKRPLAGTAAVLAYSSRYIHWVALSNSRLLSMDETGLTFRWKDCRAKEKTRHKTMTLARELPQIEPIACPDVDSPEAPNDAHRTTFVCSHCAADDDHPDVDG